MWNDGAGGPSVGARDVPSLVASASADLLLIRHRKDFALPAGSGAPLSTGLVCLEAIL